MADLHNHEYIMTLKEFYSQFVKLEDKAWAEFINSLTRKTIPKNQYLLKFGDICTETWFIEDGLIYGRIKNDDKIIGYDFYTENDTINAIHSYTTGAPSDMDLIALQDSTVWSMSKEDDFRLSKKNPIHSLIKEFGHAMFIKRMKERLLGLLTKSPEERLKELMFHNTELFQKVPHNLLASHLGITPESFSRIKKRFATNGIS